MIARFNDLISMSVIWPCRTSSLVNGVAVEFSVLLDSAVKDRDRKGGLFLPFFSGLFFISETTGSTTIRSTAETLFTVAAIFIF